MQNAAKGVKLAVGDDRVIPASNQTSVSDGRTAKSKAVAASSLKTAAADTEAAKAAAVKAVKTVGKTVKTLPAAETHDSAHEAVAGRNMPSEKAAVQSKLYSSSVSATALSSGTASAAKAAVAKTAAVKTAAPHADTEAAAVPKVQQGSFGNYRVYHSAKYGKFVNVRDFGADTTGKTDSHAAIKRALEAAHKEKAMLYMQGKFYISDQIAIDGSTSGVKGIFGAGMGKTVIRFDKKQTGVFNPDTNHDDIRKFAGVLIDGQNGKKISGLSVQYSNKDFYRKGLSYFGKVSGILVNDADNTVIDSVEVSGANRAGVLFTSTAALGYEKGKKFTYKERVQNGEIDENYKNLPLGSNNQIINSNLHHNRVAGLLAGYQEKFTASGNKFAYNGHAADGGTGYGAAVMAGSYNYGITFRKNTTDHNYRKGLDVHDGTGILIQNNTLNGDRLYGIAVYNRQFAMKKAVITGNTIIQDKNFRLANDDNLGAEYRLYSGIQMQTNTEFRNFKNTGKGYFEISNNTIKNLTLYGDNIQQYGIEFRNHEAKADYTANITGNNISGASAKYLIAVINDTKHPDTGKIGLGSGTINISGNTADIGTIAKGAVPFYVEEKNANGLVHRGKIIIDSNSLTVRDRSDGYAEFTAMSGNAKSYHVTNNKLNLGGKLEDGIVSVRDTGRAAADVEISVANNSIKTKLAGALYKSWVRATDVEVYAEGNTHNGSKLDTVNNTGHAVSLSDVLSTVSQTVAHLKSTAYSLNDTAKVEDHISNSGII